MCVEQKNEAQLLKIKSQKKIHNKFFTKNFLIEVAKLMNNFILYYLNKIEVKKQQQQQKQP